MPKRTADERPIEELNAGGAFREKMLGRADGTDGPYPWWHGWVIMDAFLAGIDYEKSRPLPMTWPEPKK